MDAVNPSLSVVAGNRRISRRRPAHEVPYLRARLVAGPPVELLDVSRRGILIQTESRLLPGSPIAIKFVAADAGLVLRGCVVRSSVAVLNGAEVKYHTAVAFNDDIALCDEALWSNADEPDVATPDSLTLADAPLDSIASPETGDVLTVVATIDTTMNDIEQLLASNDW